MPSLVHKHYLLGLLTVIAVFSFVDRVALGLVLDSIKADLDLSDTQLGFMGGLAFALFYAVMGIPIARWADRGNRVMIISLCVAVWSAAVALSGAATGFISLLLIRVVVAVGEAGCFPTGYSLLADYFDRGERPRAAAIYGMGPPAATIVGFLCAGWLNELYGWRMTFVLLGLPGIALAALTWLTLEEPRRLNAGGRAAAVSQPSLGQVAVTLWGNVTFRHLLLCFSVMVFFSYGIFLWLPAFVMRSYELTPVEAGTWLAMMWGVCAALGAYLGGVLASRYASDNERLQFRALAIVITIVGAFSTSAYLTQHQYVAFACIGVSTMGLAMANGPLFAAIQTLVPERMRAVSISVTFLVANIAGMGLGPLAAGILSDAFGPRSGDESLRYALLTLSSGYLLASWFAWQASNSVMRDLQAAPGARDAQTEGAHEKAPLVLAEKRLEEPS